MLNNRKMKFHIHSPFPIYSNESIQICSLCNAFITSISSSDNSHFFLNEIEKIPFDYYRNLLINDNQTNIEKPLMINDKRRVIIETYSKIKKKYSLSNNVFHLAVMLLDILIDNDKNKKNLEKLAFSCLMLSIKFYGIQTEEFSIDNLGVYFFMKEKFNHLLNKSKKEIKYNEINCLSCLKYRLNYITSIDYVEYFSCMGIFFESENVEINKKTLLKKVYDLLEEILTLAPYTSIPPLELGCVCISLARDYFKLDNTGIWRDILFNLYEINIQRYCKVFDIVMHLLNKKQTNNVRVSRPSKLFQSNFFSKTGSTNSNYNNSPTKEKSKENFPKKRIKKGIELSLDISNSSLNEYIKSNIISFKQKEKVKHKSTNNSSDSNYIRRETELSTKATPEIIKYTRNKVRNIKSFVFPYQKMKTIMPNNNESINTSRKKINLRNISDILKKSKIKKHKDNGFHRIISSSLDHYSNVKNIDIQKNKKLYQK